MSGVAGIIYRIPKGAPLTAAEMDNNLLLLSNAVGDVQTDVAAAGKVFLSDTKSTPPAESDRTTTAWVIKTTSDAGTWVWNAGLTKWISRHQVPPSSSYRAIWVGVDVDLQTFDGGDAGVVSDAAGPMWEVDTTFDAKFPIGSGTLPSTVVITTGGTGGEETHVLTVPEMPAHTHDFYPLIISDANNGGANGVQYGATANVPTSSTGGGGAHNNMPPYIGVRFIKRTARVYRAIT